MYKTILVPIDLGHAERGKAMLDVASYLVDKGGRIIVANVIEDIPNHVAAQIPNDLLKDTTDNAREEIEGMAKAAGISAEIEVRHGRPSTAINSIAEAKGADLIVIASHRPGLQDYLLGSTAAGVVRHAQCSVLVMR
jgi:nucleotide-binding universal stress UspA family protein